MCISIDDDDDDDDDDGIIGIYKTKLCIPRFPLALDRRSYDSLGDVVCICICCCGI